MKFTVLTLFPEFIKPLLEFSIIKRAIKNKLIEIEIINFRDYSSNKTKRVDEYQIGGGEGMVLQLEPIVKCLKNIEQGYKILLSPQGRVLNQHKLKVLAKKEHIILICGHYEGFDERIQFYVDEEFSIGDYILTNGEIPALIFIDGISRLLNGVIKQDSFKNESFENNLLDYPIYTKPLDFEGYKVPEILLSGNHKKINAFRKEQQIIKTKTKRPDLYKKYLRGRKNEQDGF